MSETVIKLATVDPVWSKTCEAASRLAQEEPVLSSYLQATVLNHDNMNSALTFHLAQKLGNAEFNAMLLRQVMDEAFANEPSIAEQMRADIVAWFERDPACKSYLEPFLYFKGFHALQSYRVAHWLWNRQRRAMSLFLQSRISEVFAADIHPAARIGRGIMIDHATSVVIGETAVIEDDVSMLHEVTLGGTGKETGDRHPKIRRGVLIGAGAKILGNIEIGECARIGAGSVVLNDVPAHCTAAGVPARLTGCAGSDQPSHNMDHNIVDEPDYSI